MIKTIQSYYWRRRVIPALGATMIALTLVACPKKGPAARAGEKVDRAADKVSDTLNPKGPAEKAGRAIDPAVD